MRRDLRKAIILLKKRKMSPFCASLSQSSHVVSLSWLYGLLLPLCVFRNSSPAQNIGVPLASINSVKKFFTWRRRNEITSADVFSSPSQPQFQLTLFSQPSVLLWPLASLCL